MKNSRKELNFCISQIFSYFVSRKLPFFLDLPDFRKGVLIGNATPSFICIYLAPIGIYPLLSVFLNSLILTFSPHFS